MRKKLSAEESLKSLSAINDYRIDNHGNEKKRVVVVKNGNTIFNDVVSVIASMRRLSATISASTKFFPVPG